MAVQIIRINSQVSVPNQITKIMADLAVSTVSELPAANGIDNYILLDTSIALVRQTGDYYVLDGGTWYAADGSGAAGGDSDSVQSLSVSPNLNLSPQLETSIRPALNLNALPVDVPENDEPEVTDEIAEPEPEEEPAEDGEEQ